MSVRKFIGLLFIFVLYIVVGFALVLYYFKDNIFPSYKTSSKQSIQIPDKTHFSLEQAPSESIRGNIVSLSGNVFWQSRVATEPAALLAPRQIQQGEKVVTKEKGTVNLELGLGLLIQILQNSSLEFIQTLPNNFILKQNDGIISYSKSNAVPLTVRALELVVEIYKGELNLIVDKEKQLVTLELPSSEAKIGFNDLEYITQVKSLLKGNKYIFNNETKKITIIPLVE